MLVKEVMKTAIGVEKDITLKKASEIMSKKDITSLFVVEGVNVVGIVDEGDLVDNFGSKKPISEIMTQNVIIVSPEDSLDSAKQIMTDKKVDVLPVVDSKEGLVGVISSKDILREESNSDHFLME